MLFSAGWRSISISAAGSCHFFPPAPGIRFVLWHVHAPIFASLTATNPKLVLRWHTGGCSECRHAMFSVRETMGRKSQGGNRACFFSVMSKTLGSASPYTSPYARCILRFKLNSKAASHTSVSFFLRLRRWQATCLMTSARGMWQVLQWSLWCERSDRWVTYRETEAETNITPLQKR